MIDTSQISEAVGQDLTAEDVNLDAYLEDLPDGRKTLRLEYPFEIKKSVNGGTMEPVLIEELGFDRPKAGHLDILANSKDATVLADMRTLIHKLTDTPANLLRDKMDTTDFFRCLILVTGFFPKPKSRKTGETSPDD